MTTRIITLVLFTNQTCFKVSILAQ